MTRECALQWGWLAELDIPTAVQTIDELDDGLHYVLISAIDSTFDVTELQSLFVHLHDIGASAVKVGHAVAVERRTFDALIKEEFFNGFDEVWLCRSIPQEPKPSDVRLTSDAQMVSAPSEAVGEWMCKVGCLLGLGDGAGLNFVTVDGRIASALHDVDTCDSSG
ncbi:MAG: hypothetical protein QOJ82_1185 [Solirubrobacteraceae bacterium]|jgi:hypothetical protein|nr:hypothetical protein [Solirubrobacteraceae bacterium]